MCHAQINSNTISNSRSKVPLLSLHTPSPALLSSTPSCSCTQDGLISSGGPDLYQCSALATSLTISTSTRYTQNHCRAQLITPHHITSQQFMLQHSIAHTSHCSPSWYTTLKCLYFNFEDSFSRNHENRLHSVHIIIHFIEHFPHSSFLFYRK